VKFSSTIKI